MNKMKILTVNGQSYEVFDPEAARIDDTGVADEKTWSSRKISETFGTVETALDGILAIQNELIGGGTV